MRVVGNALQKSIDWTCGVCGKSWACCWICGVGGKSSHTTCPIARLACGWQELDMLLDTIVMWDIME